MRPLLLLALLLVGCPTPDEDTLTQDDADDFADRLADDVAHVAASAVNIVSAADDLEERDSASECAGTVGTCVFCFDVLGTPLEGSFTLGMEDTPCGVAWEVAGRSLNYSVTHTDIAGTWTATGLGGVYTVEASGDRAAVLGLQSAREGTRELDSSYGVVMTAEVENLQVEGLTLSMTYRDFLDGTWSVEVTAAEGVVDGAVVGPEGTSCSLSGAVESPVVTCTVPGA